MARDQDRHFSESENLFAPGADAFSPQGEDRLPAWAQEMEKAAEKEKSPARFSAPEHDAQEKETPGDENAETAEIEDKEDKEEKEEKDRSKPAEIVDEEEDLPEPVIRGHREAEEAWDREAQKAGNEKNRKNRKENKKEKREKSAAEEKNGKNGNKGKDGKKNRKKKTTAKANDRRSFLRTMAIILICGALFVMVAAMIASNFLSSPWLALPRKIVTTVVTPVQTAFSHLTESVADYVRMLKIRGNIEYEYNQLLMKLDDMANDTAMMEELRRENEELQSIVQEQSETSHLAMNPIGAQVIGTVGNNYFSTLTLNVGKENGVDDYMAVVSNGGLVGVTYNTRERECNVRCIIDSDCTVAALVQSSRDQGSVKGTLGSTGEAICRMYYLPDNSLPRPGDVVVTSGVGLEFPKGIPIGYIRESTRGMEDNKSYVVLEPKVDFQHLEYVTVYRYRPSYAESAQNRTSTGSTITLETLTTARPVPEFQMGGLSDFMYVSTPAPTDESGATAAPGASETPAPAKTGTPAPGQTMEPNLEYVPVDLTGATPSPSPRPTFTPTPSPAPTPDPGALTVEDD